MYETKKFAFPIIHQYLYRFRIILIFDVVHDDVYTLCFPKKLLSIRNGGEMHRINSSE